MITLTDENFEKEILNSSKPTLVDFWASRCPACVAMGPTLEKLAKDYGEKLIFAKANVELAPIISQKYGIDRIPTLIFFNGGKPIAKFIGLSSEQILKSWIDQNLNLN